MRVLDRKSQLIDELVQIAGHTSGDDARRTIKTRLHQLAEIMRAGVVDGWGNIADGTKAQLDHWLDDAAQAKRPSETDLAIERGVD